MVQATRSVSYGGVYYIHLESARVAWYWAFPVAVHLHFGSGDPGVFVGTRRRGVLGRFEWYQASPRETCLCSSCVER
jgi:hypothetical protein